jgi:hypothetical protein
MIAQIGHGMQTIQPMAQSIYLETPNGLIEMRQTPYESAPRFEVQASGRAAPPVGQPRQGSRGKDGW